ncbi:MAG: hypothetical protein LUD29_00685 [Clostridia bacterium]|nr:hypothetical protein [Clostridia bacterium]
MKKKLCSFIIFALMAVVAVAAVFGVVACDKVDEVPKIGSIDTGKADEVYDTGRLSVPNPDKDEAALTLNGEIVEGYNYTIEAKKDDSDNVYYAISGTTSEMTETIASWFNGGTLNGAAQPGDAYITLKIEVKEGNTITYSSYEREKTYTNTEEADGDVFDGDYLFIIDRLTGVHDDGTAVEIPENEVFTITDSEGELVEEITIKFERIVLPNTGSLSVPDSNADTDALTLDGELVEGYNYTIELVAEGGDVHYELSGEASEMTEAIASWFNGGSAEGAAQPGDAYITLKIYVGEGNTIEYESDDKKKSYTNSDGADKDVFDDDYLFIIVRLSGVRDDGSEVVVPESKIFTIIDENGNTIEEITVKYNGIIIPVSSAEGEPEE